MWSSRYWLFPTRCACCGRVIHHDESLCDGCKSALPVIEDGICPGCGCEQKRCQCVRKPRSAAECVSPYFYQGVVKHGLLRLKKGNATDSADFFGEKMARLCRERYGEYFDGVVYVPTDSHSQETNHSRLLAKAMAKELGIPLLDGGLTRVYETHKQHRSSLRRRRGNVFGVFAADPTVVAHKHLLLVDDIITTGATMDECCKMLLLADCEEVCGVTAASTKLNPKEGLYEHG